MNFGYYSFMESKSELVLGNEQESIFSEYLLNHMTESAFFVGSNAEVLFVNNATCRLTEYEREELLAMSLSKIDIEYSQEKWLQKWQRVKNQGSLHFQSRYKTKTSKIFPVDVNLIYSQQRGLEFGCVFVRESSYVTIDTESATNSQEDLEKKVSEYQQTEAQLQTSLSLLRSTLESTANGILAINFEGEILYYNHKYLEMWNLPSSVVLSKKCQRAQAHFESLVVDVEHFRSRVWDIPGDCDRESYELVELKDGRIFAHYAEPQRIGDKIIGRVWSFWDVTESKRTENALRLNENRFRSLAESTEACIFLIKDSRVCYANPATELLTGYKVEELVSGFNLNQLIMSRNRRQVYKEDGSTSCEYQEMQIITKNGTQRCLACTVTMLRGRFDFEEKPVELITAIDITDYKQAESEVRQALEQAKRLSEIRNRFVSMLCHQFRTPLNVVSFSADLLRRHISQWTEEKNRSYLDLIQVAVKQISQLLDDILLFGQAETARLECEPRAINLKHFCRDIIVQLQLGSGNQKSIDFIHRGDCSNVYLDPKFLHHILTNLLSNSIKYSPGSSDISLEINCQDRDIYFYIKDTGIGIAKVDLQQIFEPFYRGNNVDNIPGTGLGLSIVKILVELHNGEVFVDSKVGVGTTFTVKLTSTPPQLNTLGHGS